MNPSKALPPLFAASFLALVACAPAVEATDAGASTTSPDAGEPADAGIDAGASTTSPDAGEPADAGILAIDAGFGSPCTMDGAAPCDDGLLCLAPIGNAGFCSKNCPRLGPACAGAPTGTYAYCGVGPTGTPNGLPGCIFLCTGGGRTFTCPGATACAPTEDPPGSGQRLCLP